MTIKQTGREEYSIFIVVGDTLIYKMMFLNVGVQKIINILTHEVKKITVLLTKIIRTGKYEKDKKLKTIKNL